MTRIALEDGGELIHLERWLDADESRAALEALLLEVPWAQKPIVIMGKTVLQPRMVAWYGEPDAVYTYSGATNVPLPWTPLLSGLRARVSAEAGVPFDSVLLNLYRDGRDSMGLHADAERALGQSPVIGSLSLGATRRLVLRHARRPREVPGRELELADGSLLIMRGTTQHFWKHAVPKARRVTTPRINLTFRRLLR